MPNPRLELALEQVGPADWREFELFAAEFLSIDYPSLRTTASLTGDRGRDGEVFVVDEEPRTFVQYSVTANWEAKIRATIRSLKENGLRPRVLIYATNRRIGPSSDELISQMRKTEGVSLDVRDQSWFIDREGTHPQRAIASEELIRSHVDPLLVERRVKQFVAPSISGHDARLALLHLALDTTDAATSKGHTKRSFEALTLSALYGTSAGHTMRRLEIVERVTKLLPASQQAQTEELTSSALDRLSVKGGPVKRLKDGDHYHLSFEKSEETKRRIATYMLQEQRLEQELVDATKIISPEAIGEGEDWSSLGEALRRGLETVLLRRGEAFAGSIKTGRMQQLDTSEILSVVSVLNQQGFGTLSDEQITAIIVDVLDQPSPFAKEHLHSLADSYTIFAFLQQTPDVQKVLSNLFTGGELWLDTSVLLPLLAETLVETGASRYYTTMFRAARDAGLHLYVTLGIAEEIERHLNRCLIFSRTETSRWRGEVPFLYSAFTLSGRRRSDFYPWAEMFRGQDEPTEDIVEYLQETHGVALRNLQDEVDDADDAVKAAIQEIWLEAHEKRRGVGSEHDLDTPTKILLANHDVETTLGIMQLRSKSGRSHVGHREWLLTLDSVALKLQEKLVEWLGDKAPQAPVISPDFMSQYFRLGPLRTAINRQLWADLPVITDVSRYDFLPLSLIDEADKIRAELGNLSDLVARRRVRELLNRRKRTFGPEAIGGARLAKERVMAAIAQSVSDLQLHRA